VSWIKNNEWLKPDQDNRVRWGELRRFAEHYRPFRGQLGLAVALAIVGSASAFLIPLVFWKLQEAITYSDVRLLVLGLGGLLLITVADALTLWGIRVIRARVTVQLNRELVLEYYRKILNLAIEDFIAFRRSTNLFQRVMDAMNITSAFTDVLLRGAQSVVLLVVVGAVVAWLSPAVLGVLVLGSAALFAYTVVQSDKLRVLRQRTLALNFPLVGKMTEIIGGLFTIKALAASVRVTSDITGLIDGKKDSEYDEYVGEARLTQVGEIIRAVTQVYAIGVSIAQLWYGSLQVADIFSLYMLSALFLAPVVELATRYHSLSRLSVNVGNYYQVIDLQDEADEARSAGARRLAAARAVPALAAGSAVDARVGTGPGEMGAPWRPEPPARGHIVFSGVDFGYRGGETVIRNLDLEIQPGEKISLIGKSGVGKTTLFRLLLGFLQPQRGEIWVDGVEVGSLADKNAYRRQFGVVSQHDVLFGVSMRENLGFGLEGAVAEERMEEALRMVNLWQDVERAGGIDAQYSEDLFSGGQRQRFFIARALLRKPQIVLLDEPTSALDFENEALVMQAVEALVGDRTTLTIAHRLTTVREADRVVVLEGGTVHATGTHDELYARNEYYRALCDYNSFVV
jgi:ABC-type multidrug transport system fused ATPase/permease subunit